MRIGLRIPGEGRKMPFEQFCKAVAAEGFQAVDVGVVTDDVKRTADAAGLAIGSSDLMGGRELMSADPAKQAAGAKAAREAIDAAAAHGCKIMFGVVMPEDPTKGRAAAFELWKKTFPPILQYAESKGVKMAVEGWPGPAPYYPNLGCTPETLRAMIAECPSPALAVNFDPSHLVRIGIDYLRFLAEFGPRVVHCHGKDTAFDLDALYLHGNLGPSLKKAKGFGEEWWRYCIPGDGVVDWAKVVARLEDFGFNGIISVELEDYRYWKDWPAQLDGLRRARAHLAKWVR